VSFDHPTKKNELVRGSPWEVAMAGLELMESSHGGSPERGKRGQGKGRRQCTVGVWLGKCHGVGEW
jgi:hypothetical protein